MQDHKKRSEIEGFQVVSDQIASGIPKKIVFVIVIICEILKTVVIYWSNLKYLEYVLRISNLLRTKTFCFSGSTGERSYRRVAAISQSKIFFRLFFQCVTFWISRRQKFFYHSPLVRFAHCTPEPSSVSN